MALTLESAGRVRQKARLLWLRNPGVFYAVKTWFLYHATNNGNPDLQFVAIDGNTNASDGGNTASQVLADAPCKVYVLYLKKTGATATFFKATNHASTATTDGTQDLGYKLTTASEENVFIYPAGHTLSVGLTVTEDTTATGSTLTLAANKIDGFVIIGS